MNSIKKQLSNYRRINKRYEAPFINFCFKEYLLEQHLRGKNFRFDNIMSRFVIPIRMVINNENN